MSPGGEFSNTFLNDGTFPYFDLTNPWMVGSIIINPEECQVPSSGNWMIGQNCKLMTSATTPANVIVQNNSVLEIPNGVTLDIDFANFNLTIKSGSGVLIKSGGIIT